MLREPFNVKLDLVKNKTNNAFEVVSRDLNVIYLIVTKNNVPCDLTGYTVTANYQNSLGQVLDGSEVLDVNQTVGLKTTTIPDSVLANAGNVDVEIVFTKDTEIATSRKFSFYVRKGIGDDSEIVPVPERPNWQAVVAELIARIEALESGIVVPPTSNWILATGIWNDSGMWADTEMWRD